MNPNTQDNNREERPRTVRIAALLGVIIMAGLIIAAVVVAVLKIENAEKTVIGLLSVSFFLGVMVYLVGLFSKLSKRKREGYGPEPDKDQK